MKSSQVILVLGLLVGVSSGVVGAELSAPEKNFEALWKTFHERYAYISICIFKTNPFSKLGIQA